MCLDDRSKIKSRSELYESTLFKTRGNFEKEGILDLSFI